MLFYKRIYSPGELQFVSTSTYCRAPLFRSGHFCRCFVQRLEGVRYRIPLSQKGCHATLDSNTSAPCPVRRSSRRRQ